MRVRHTELFDRTMEEILSCGHRYYSRATIKSLYSQYKNFKDLIANNPMLGQTEPLLEGFAMDYRRVHITPFFKIIYTVYDDDVIFVDLWDTRQSPETLISRID